MGMGGPGNNFSDADESDGTDLMAEINITPLTDVFLVLLIIFMVTSSVMSQMGMDVDLPTASDDMSQAQPEGVVVTLLSSGRMKVNEESIPKGDWRKFRERLANAFLDAKDRLVILEGDRKAYLGSAIEVMDHARKAGAENFAIATSTK